MDLRVVRKVEQDLATDLGMNSLNTKNSKLDFFKCMDYICEELQVLHFQV